MSIEQPIKLPICRKHLFGVGGVTPCEKCGFSVEFRETEASVMDPSPKVAPPSFYECPSCKSTDLKVIVETWMNLDQDGDGNIQTTGEGESTEWGKNSLMECKTCGEQGITETFEVSKLSDPPEPAEDSDAWSGGFADNH